MFGIKTDGLLPKELDLTFLVRNHFDRHTLVTSRFSFRSCEAEVPKVNSYSGLTDELMFDYTGLYQNLIVAPLIKDQTVVGDPWTFVSGAQHCSVTLYEFHCEDSQGN